MKFLHKSIVKKALSEFWAGYLNLGKFESTNSDVKS